MHLIFFFSLKGGGKMMKSRSPIGHRALDFHPRIQGWPLPLQTSLAVVKIRVEHLVLCSSCVRSSYKQCSPKEDKTLKMSSVAAWHVFLSHWEQKGVPRAFLGGQPSS